MTGQESSALGFGEALPEEPPANYPGPLKRATPARRPGLAARPQSTGATLGGSQGGSPFLPDRLCVEKNCILPTTIFLTQMLDKIHLLLDIDGALLIIYRPALKRGKAGGQVGTRGPSLELLGRRH